MADTPFRTSSHVHMAVMQETVVVDALLVAAGRSPNVAGLGLEAAGVQYNAGCSNVGAIAACGHHLQHCSECLGAVQSIARGST